MVTIINIYTVGNVVDATVVVGVSRVIMPVVAVAVVVVSIAVIAIAIATVIVFVYVIVGILTVAGVITVAGIVGRCVTVFVIVVFVVSCRVVVVVF